jgi:tetratricopeptide (TPR) repeat protein
MKRLIAMLGIWMFAGAQGAAADDGCPVRERNQGVLQQADRYLDEHGSSPAGHISEVDWAASGGWRFKKPTKPRDADYLQAPIDTVEALREADKQAQNLESKNQVSLAKAIRNRMAAASNTIYGQKLGTQQMICLSTAERLRKAAWELFTQEAYPLAEKSYRGVVEIYQKELGDDVTTANAFGELARVLAAEGKHADAEACYQKADAVYRLHPSSLNADSASVLEAYGELLSNANKRIEATRVYDEARVARKNAYRSKYF